MSDDAVSMGVEPGDGPVFREPWEAQAFAITVLLHQQGVFTWPEWSRELSAQIAAAESAEKSGAAEKPGAPGTLEEPRVPGAPGSGETYYHHWLAALEAIVATKGLGSTDELTRYQRAWAHAAHRTPHGASIELQSQDIELSGA